MSDTLTEKRAGVTANLVALDDRVAGIGDAAARARLEREVGEIKSRAAMLIPQNAALQKYRAPASDGRYAGVTASDDRSGEIVREVEEKVRALARNRQMNGDAMVARYAGGAVPAVTAEKWASDEIAERIAFEAGGEAPPETVPAADMARHEAERVRAHAHIGKLYSGAAQALHVHELSKAALRSHDEAEKDGDGDGEQDERLKALRRQPLTALVRTVLTEAQRERLESGDASAVAGVDADKGTQERIARSYLDEASRSAPAVERERLAAARRSLGDYPDRNDRSKDLPRSRTRGRSL